VADAFVETPLMGDDDWHERETPLLEDIPEFAKLSADKIIAIGDFAAGPVEGISFDRLAPPDLRIPQPPRFLFGNVPEHILGHYFSGWGLSSIGVFLCRDVRLVGEFLVGRDDRIFRSPELNIHPAHIKQALDKYAGKSRDLLRRKITGRHVVLAGPGYNVYGHWLAEYLPKLGVLHSAGHNLGTLSYLLPTSVPSFVFEWLKVLGVRESQLNLYDPERELLLADELLLPSILHAGIRFSPLFKDIAAFLKRLVVSQNGPVAADPARKRLFISRHKFGAGRSLVNRERIEQMSVDAGFALVYPEDLSLLDQVALFSGASHIIGEYGSALHASMFAAPGTVVCALRGNALHPGFLQSGLGEVMGQPTGYVIGENESSDPNARFTVSEHAFETCLKLIFRSVAL
jgi:hypothetical protein